MSPTHMVGEPAITRAHRLRIQARISQATNFLILCLSVVSQVTLEVLHLKGPSKRVS